jgi:site-specific DNA-methyltransferase (adenine-specific)
MPGPRGGDPAGRWPSNVLLTSPIFDGDVPGVVGGGWQSGGGNPANRNVGRDERTSLGNGWHQHETGLMPTDTEGTYSRFFLIPKADRADREPVLGGLPQRELATHGARGQGPLPQQTPQAPIRRANVHPTVKPTDLMRHLVRLVTPPGGLVLDPFLGSGTTALACEMEGFAWLGIEREAEYVAIAEARLNGTQKGLGLTG